MVIRNRVSVKCWPEAPVSGGSAWISHPSLLGSERWLACCSWSPRTRISGPVSSVRSL